MLLIGVTGSIGMGKSTVAKMFTEYGFGLYNADDTVHYIYENDEEVINKIEESFPGTKSEGKVNRIALRDILVTASEDKQKERVVAERKVPLEIFNSIKNQQMPDREKLKKADYIISTDQTLDETKLEVKDVVSKIKLINPKAWKAFYKK